MKILHVITGLYTGGAEMMLVNLLETMPRAEAEHAVIALTGGGRLVERIAVRGIPVTVLKMTRGLPALREFYRLVRTIALHKPDVVQCWMYHANLGAGLAAKLAGGPPVIWNIRQSALEAGVSKRSTIVVAKAGAYLSRWLPRTIVCCAESARVVHEAMGYAAERMVVIPNGFDLTRFHPDPEARAAIRGELRLPEGAVLVGLPARFDPQKDHLGFLDAAKRLRAQMPRAHFLLCGDNLDSRNRTLVEWIVARDLGGAVHLLGARADMPRIMAACDAIVSASAFGEGFSNVLGEAMASGTPCVATDVGDSRAIIGDTGVTVPPRDPAALADALARLLGLPSAERAAMGERARQRIAEHYSLDAISRRYADLYRAAATERH